MQWQEVHKCWFCTVCRLVEKEYVCRVMGEFPSEARRWDLKILRLPLLYSCYRSYLPVGSGPGSCLSRWRKSRSRSCFHVTKILTFSWLRVIFLCLLRWFTYILFIRSFKVSKNLTNNTPMRSDPDTDPDLWALKADPEKAKNDADQHYWKEF
jgi:hypothetical protein